MKTLALDLEGSLQKIELTKRRLDHMAKVLPTIAPAFDACTWAHAYEDGIQIICEVKTREGFAPIRALHKGVWDKSIEPGKATYRAEVQGIWIICNVSELPPSCKIEEQEVYVPAHKEIRRKVVCNGVPEPQPELVES